VKHRTSHPLRNQVLSCLLLATASLASYADRATPTLETPDGAEPQIDLGFNRSVPAASINALLETNLDETAARLQSPDLQIFTVQSDTSENLPFHAAPLNWVTSWDKMSSNLHASLLGLYIPNSDHGTILLNSHATKWTLVHEFLHHLLFKAEVGLTPPSLNAPANLDQLKAAWKATHKDQPAERAKKLLRYGLGLD